MFRKSIEDKQRELINKIINKDEKRVLELLKKKTEPQLLIVNYMEFSNKYYDPRLSPLMKAISYNNSLKVIQALLKNGAAIDHRDAFGNNVLHIAISQSNPAIVEELIKAGADATMRNNVGLTPLLKGIKQNLDEDAVRSFCKILSPEKRSAVINYECSDPFTYQGYTALLMASEKYNAKVLSALLDYGANVNHINKRTGETALMIAAHNNCFSSVTLLLKYGTKVNLVDRKGNSALYHASYNNNMAMVEELLQHNADPNLGGVENKPLICATQVQNIKMCNLLLSYGATITFFNAFYKLLERKHISFISLYQMLVPDQDMLLSLANGFDAMLSQSKKQQIQFNHEHDVKEHMKSLEKPVMEYRTSIHKALNPDLSRHFPAVLSNIVSEYLGFFKMPVSESSVSSLRRQEPIPNRFSPQQR